MLTQPENIVSEGPRRVEDGIAEFDTPVAERNLRFAFRHEFAIHINNTLIGNIHRLYLHLREPAARIFAHTCHDIQICLLQPFDDRSNLTVADGGAIDIDHRRDFPTRPAEESLFGHKQFAAVVPLWSPDPVRPQKRDRVSRNAFEYRW